ncbi:MAG TPA: permease-like cell division protein FtsX [Vicinamibacterales bacterium]|nr:permease-like cell division protein FtsX [Vicinamibacterales bacterium]
MRAFDYAFRHGAASLWRSRGSSAFAVLAITLALVVLGVLLLLTWNAEQLLSRWTSSSEFSVYLADAATSEQRGTIESAIDSSGISAGREYISKAQALTRFRQEFADLASLAEGLGDNPFPASIEVRVSQGAERDGRVDAFVKKVVQLPGVVDVRYDRDWLARVGTALDTVRAAGLMLALLMGLAAAVTVATVVRLGLLARHDEIEIMELVGAPLSYIRGPFVAEGFLQGGIGAVLAILFLWLSHAVANAWWGTELRALFEGDALRFLPVRLATSLILGGMFVGSTGGLAAAWRAGSDPR